MRRALLCLFLGWSMVLHQACADTRFFSDASAITDGGCKPGEIRCTEGLVETCAGGVWKQEKCPAGKICIEKLGCRVCDPGTTFCDGQDIMKCAADGQSKTKLETCAADQQCLLGTCLGLCDTPGSKDRSNVGCEFWAVDLPNEYYCSSFDGGATCIIYGCAACQTFAVVVANVQTFPVTVTIDQNDAAPGQPLQLQKLKEKTLAPSSLEVFELPMREVDCTEWQKDATGRLRRKTDSQTCLTSRAFHVKSTAPVVAYQFNPIVNEFSNGASLLIPTTGLDTTYYVLGWSTANPISIPMPGNLIEGLPDYTNITVIGVKEQTEVEVRLAHSTQGSKDGKVPAAKLGQTIKVKLGPYDVLNINSIQDLFSASGDLSGSLVKANKPVAVFSGAQRAIVPIDPDKYNPPAPKPPDLTDLCCTEHMEQQLFPTSSLGTSFVITHSAPRQKGSLEPDFYRVLAGDEGTTNITTNLTEFPKITLQGGQFHDFWAIRDFVLSADKAVMVAQYTVSQKYLTSWSGPGGDPDFVIFAPVEQHRKDYIFLTPSTFDKDYVILAAPRGARVLLDGRDVNEEINPLCPRFAAGPMKGEDYNAIRCEVKDGVHRIESTKPVGITVYGYYNVGSYAYPGGADVRQINVD